eukprot:561588-Prymnesium_polylepis.2
MVGGGGVEGGEGGDLVEGGAGAGEGGTGESGEGGAGGEVGVEGGVGEEGGHLLPLVNTLVILVVNLLGYGRALSPPSDPDMLRQKLTCTLEY